MLVKEIILSKETREIINAERIKIGVDGENLQEKLIFKFDDEFVDGQGRAEIVTQDGDKSYIILEKVNETYELPVKSVITKKGLNYIQLVIDEGGIEHIPVFKSKKLGLLVADSINATEEAPEGYEQWIEIANAKLNQMDNLDIDVNKVDHTATITITKKDETQEIVNVYDGIGLNYNWSGTSLGVKREDESNYDYVNLQGPVGPAGSIRMEIVNTLPDVGQEGTLYFVPKTPETSDLYDEYVWVNNAWELIGEKQITVDLTDYVKNTDYATSSKGGVIKLGNSFNVNTSGVARADVRTYENYSSAGDNLFIGKGTLENVITGKGLVSNTDYATDSTGGVIKANGYYDIAMTNGNIYALKRTYSYYTDSSPETAFISKGTLENVLTARIGDIQTLLDNLDTGNGV